jgi:hypothetical protein
MQAHVIVISGDEENPQDSSPDEPPHERNPPETEKTLPASKPQLVFAVAA